MAIKRKGLRFAAQCPDATTCLLLRHIVCARLGVSMEVTLTQGAVLLAITTGIVSAGLASSVWTLLTDEDLSLWSLTESDLFTPLRVIMLVLAAPMIMFTKGFLASLERPVVLIPSGIFGLAWSFFQGVFILTTVFGLT